METYISEEEYLKLNDAHDAAVNLLDVIERVQANGYDTVIPRDGRTNRKALKDQIAHLTTVVKHWDKDSIEGQKYDCTMVQKHGTPEA